MLKNIYSKENLMITQTPDTFPIHQYQWMLGEHTKANGVWKILLDTKEQKDAILDHPFQMTQRAVDDGFSEIWLCVKDGKTMKLKAANLLAFGRRIGMI